MTRIDFYVLPEHEDTGPVLTACKLCEKAIGQKLKVYVFAPDAGLAQDFDQALWTFKQGSFIAHERVTPALENQPLAEVLIGAERPPPSHRDVLVNLGAEPPPFFGDFGRVLEIVHGDAAARAKARARFQFYRERGCAPETHKL